MVDFSEFNDGASPGENVTIVDSSDPSKKARVITGTDGVDRLQTSANLDSGQLVPTITNKLRMPLSTSSITVGAAYSSMYTYSGTGLFFGFQAAFNSANVRMKLEIDGGVVFENTIAEFRDFQFNDTTTTRTQMGGFLTTIGNTLDFSSRYAIPFETNVTISFQRSDGTDHINNNWIVFLTQDS